MAAIHYAYQSFYNNIATPTQLYQVDLADKALAEIDRIRDLSDPVNRRKLRILAENMDRNSMNDGGGDDLTEAIIQSWMTDSVMSHTPLFELVEFLATPPDPEE
jgi:hypothetical protein